MAINKGYLTADRTSDGDEVYTPFYAVEPILEFVSKSKTIWCPFDEKWSAYYQLFNENGFNVVRSCLSSGQDFFDYQPEHWDILISNPPFSKKDEILERAYLLGKPFALLLPVNSIQGKKRYSIFNNNIEMLVFDERIDYHTQNNMQTTQKGNYFGSAYFCKDLLPTKLELRQLIKYERPLIDSSTGKGDINKWE